MKNPMFLGVGFLLTLALASAPAAAETQITFWTTEVERDRLEIQKRIAGDFTRATGIGVRVVPVDENRASGPTSRCCPT
jgi:ABC-type glycerol-3-phosphate transport system substrate-binding protein